MGVEPLGERRLERLIEAGRTLVSELHPERVLRRLLEAARELTGAQYAALGILDRDRTGLERFITVGIDERTRAAIGDLPRGRGVLGLLITDPKPLRLSEVGDHPRSYGFPPGHPSMHTFLGLPILIRGEVWGNLYLTEKGGGREFTDADEAAGVVLAEWAAIAIDNARLYEAAEGRRQSLERAVGRLEAMTEIARAIGGETDLARVRDTVVKRGRALVSAKWVAMLQPEGGELVITATAGELNIKRRGLRTPLEGSLAGSVLQSMGSARFADLAERKATRGDVWIDAQTALMVPLIFRGSGIGVLVAADKLEEEARFSPDDERLLTGFAASAATALATARSVKEERLHHTVVAAERERGRWARELHDDTLQGLGAVRVSLASALQTGSPDAISGAAREAAARIGEEIEKLRGLIAELRPAALDELGLAAAIDGLLERLETTQGIEVDKDVSLELERGAGSGRLDAEVESTVYRLIQEGLSNVAKHSRAERVSLTLTTSEGHIDIVLIDDGVGFDPDAESDGFGLVGMRERVAMVGGSLTVRSAPGSGTALRASVPALRDETGAPKREAVLGDRESAP
jgi:two-component system, NarL family, sensor histidine kinase DevS